MTATVQVLGGHIQLFSRTALSEVQWRLLSGNNRETGRGADAYPDAESCRIGVKTLQAAIDDLDGSVRRVGSNEWGWRLMLDGRLVASSQRGFDRMIRCEQGLAQFLVQLRDAHIGSSVMVSEARRW